jgi:ABC-2 type transport system ATP-binding protein
MDILFRAEHITKHYSGHCALDDVSITVPKQRIFGLLGPNGAGKTTLIRIINQIIAPDKGQLLLNNQALKPSDVKKIGYLPEERGLYKKMKVGEQAVYLAQLKGISAGDARRQLRGWFEKFDLMPWWNRKVESLSKGMQQKVQFIITVLHKPELLIFDEPFSGFDPINVNLLKQELLTLRNEGATIIFSTHNMGSVEELCDDIALINKSRKVLDGNIRDIRRRYAGQIYQVELENLRSPVESLLDSRYQVISSHRHNGLVHARVKSREQGNSNELLRQLMDQAQVIGFREHTPSMNEIFIKQVTGAFPEENVTGAFPEEPQNDNSEK